MNRITKNLQIQKSILLRMCSVLVTLISIFMYTTPGLSAQSDSTKIGKPEFIISGYLETYYCYDFNRPETDYRQAYLYNHNSHNEFNINLGIIKYAVIAKRYRVNLAMHSGTYANDNYALEKGIYKNLFEANAELAIDKKQTLWFDAGVFASHIGFESAIASDNQTLTRSLLAENSPYYLSGVKLTLKPNAKFETAFLICNGWQRIQRVAGNSLPSLGTQIKYTRGDSLTINWSTFIGTDDPDSTRRMRYFSNLYTQIKLNNKLTMTVGFDLGIQQKRKHIKDYNIWSSPVIIVRYQHSKKWATALRLENYSDKNGVIIPNIHEQPFVTQGVSLNLDYMPDERIMCRLEARRFSSENKQFEERGEFVRENYFITASVALRFEEKVSK